MLHLLLPRPLALGTKATEAGRGSPRLVDGVSGSPSRLSPVTSRPDLRPKHTGRRPCVRSSISPPASAVPWEPGQLPRVAGCWLRRCPQKKPFLVQAKRPGGLEKASTRSGTQESGQPKKRAPLVRGTVSPPLPVPGNIPRPPYVGTKFVPEIAKEIQMHDKESIIHMRAACELAARVLDYAGTLVKPSVTTDEIDKAVHKMIIDAGAYPSPLGYGGFPKSVCTSVNECMCHGIPDSRELQDGDIINIDVTVYLNGYHGDTSKTFLCGEVDEASKRLVKVTEECLLRGISTCKHGASFKKIGRRIRYNILY